MKNRKKRLLIGLLSAFLALGLIFGLCALYVADYYPADADAVAAFGEVDGVEESTLEDGSIAFLPEAPTAGFIFYPGGKVEHTAYVPLMRALAARGLLCVLVKMPLRLAVLDSNAADGVQEKYPEITDWYIGGHSLGGSMAAAYLEKNSDDYRGLVLLGAYSTADLSDTSLAVLSLYGSEDKVMNAEKYEKNKQNLPVDFTEIVIEGGCHAYFGTYGAQKGDGTPTITNAEQIFLTADAILSFVR